MSRPYVEGEVGTAVRQVLAAYAENVDVSIEPEKIQALVALTSAFLIRLVRTRVRGDDEGSVRRAWGETRTALRREARLIGDHGPVLELAQMTTEYMAGGGRVTT